MKTKRIITEQDSRTFFNTSINSIEDALGICEINLKSKQIKCDFNSVLLLRFKGVYAEIQYSLDNELFDSSFKELLQKLLILDINEKTEFDYIRSTNDNDYNFNIKLEKINLNTLKIYIICIDKLLETEKQLSLLGDVIGAGNSMFAGSTWWIDYDRYSDHFYLSESGPRILGVPINKNRLYNTKEFQKVRDKAREISEFYDQCVKTEALAFEKVRNNQTDYFGGRSPVLTTAEKIVWVEAYGKCLIRYPDGRPRFFVALDIYLSDFFELSNQLEILTNVIDYGLINSEVGVWYYQKHFQEGRYYFTQSYQELMGGTETYKNETIKGLLNEQISLMIESKNGHENYLHDFRKIHNTIFTEGLDKYHLVVPNFGNDNVLKWVEVRGTVIERDETGEVILFVGVNVDVTESFLRNKELERLRIQNERLQLAEKLAVKARDVMVWYQDLDTESNDFSLFGNDIISKKLGIPRTKEGIVSYKDVQRTIISKDTHTTEMKRNILYEIKQMYRLKSSSYKQVIAKHKNLITGEEMYLEHSAEVAEYKKDGTIKLMGGIMLDVTESLTYQQKIKYLADYDSLTDTFNRNYFEKFINESLPPTYSVLIFDLDGLKLTNDAFGHREGDKIIIQLAKFLKQVFADNLFISRIGGDEFVVVTEDVSHEKVTAKANLLEEVIEKYNLDSLIELSVSKGGKQVINNDLSFDKAFVQAENIMYRRKLNSRSSRKSKILESILETLNAKTEETKEHSDRLSKQAALTIEELGMIRSSEIEDIQLLALVHDIGKITIPDSILNKPKRLLPNEFEIIKRHSEAGYKIIRNITDSDNVCNGVLFHHERWDGNGYPQGLKGEQIPIFARVICVVDAFDAITNDRIYQKKRTEKEAIEEIISCSGTQFDPYVVKAFLKSCFNIDM